MAERTSPSLSSIGLLGEYCPSSRKKTKSSSSGISCMHIEANHTRVSHSLIKMALQNIGTSNSDDAFYRPASYATKYFGCELGAQSKFDEKTGTSLVNGAHDTAKLAGLLENFIKKYVQCYGCGNPETEIIITKTQMITLKCAACGFASDVDIRDKLTTLILKNPPESKKSSKDKKAMRRAEKERLKEGEAADEELKKNKIEAKKKGSSTASKATANVKGVVTKKKTKHSDEDHSPSHSQADENEQLANDDDVQWQTDTSLAAAQQRMQEQLSAVTTDMVMLSTGEEKKSGKKSPELEVKANENGISAHEKLVDEIKKYLNKGSSATQLQSFLGSLSGSSQEIMDALLTALFHDVVKEVALVLKMLYDNDILEEEFIMEWYQKGATGGNKSSQIWKNVKPFIEWLQNAESESDDE
ncbi:Eukaryotic translation initiation factor 5 [Hibiscus syriacus]|uniref:Eukaryotic translation initiation factor 5 n=1 Tax=Hibiscus syriacus TaxID=106335 RepID=A0A6A2WXG2_HIBSY|nr:Eukaryotic translation initiation factor 5 [Hibiscus syriacus]